MKKIQLEIIALSHSITQTHSYAVVLGEANGLRRIPIVIGGFEAQAIAVALEKMSPTRPLTHDLMKNFMLAFQVDLHEVIITDLQEGVFYSKLICSSQKDNFEIEIDSRTSDALALAVRFGCPIYTYESVLGQADGTGSADEKDKPKKHKTKTAELSSSENQSLKSLSVSELEGLLDEVLEQEDYMKAIAIRDEINKRKKQSG